MTARFPLNLDHPIHDGYPKELYRAVIEKIGDDQGMLNGLASIIECTTPDEHIEQGLTTVEALLEMAEVWREQEVNAHNSY